MASLVNSATIHSKRHAVIRATLPGMYRAYMEKEEHRCTEHTAARSRIHGNPSASTHSRWQPTDDSDVAALFDTAAGQHAGRIESHRRPSSAGAAGLWGGTHRCFSAIRGWA